MQRSSRKTALKALVFGLLFAFAQSFALAHEVTHDLSGEPELCATCSVGGQLKSAAESRPELLVSRPDVHLPEAVVTASDHRFAYQPPEARAPPQHP